MQNIEQSDYEKELVMRAKDGDLDALNTLLIKHRPMIFSIAMTIFKKKSEADDATQEIMMRIQKKIASFRGDSTFAAWIYPISHNLCIDLVKKKNSYLKKTLYDSFNEDTDFVAELAVTSLNSSKVEREISVTKKARLHIHEALESLSEKHRKILIMREIEGLTYEEMAKILNVRVGTIMSRLSNARKYFQENLESMNVDKDIFYKLREE